MLFNLRKPGRMRHQATIKRPPTASALDKRGQPTAADTTVMTNVPCTVDTLRGGELELARKTWADASYRVRLWGDPDVRIKPDYKLIIERFGTPETFHIGHVHDVDLMGAEYELLCSAAIPLTNDS